MADSIYDSSNSPYAFRTEDEAAKNRQAALDLATVNGVSKVLSAGDGGQGAAQPAAGAPGASADGGPTPEQMGVGAGSQNQSLAGAMRTAMNGVTAPGQPPPAGIQDFINYGSPAELALRNSAVQANQQQLNNPAAAFDVGAERARQNLDVAQRNQRDTTRDELALKFGGNASQTMTGLHDADQQAILDRRNLNADLTAGRATAANQGLTQAISTALGFSQLGSQEKQTNQAQQFATSERKDTQAFQSTEAEKAREAGSADQTKALQTQVDIAKMQIGSTERQQSAAQSFTAAQADLDRALSKETQERGISAQTALQRSQMDFDSAMADKGFLNAKDLESLKQEFAVELQKQGFTQQTALQAAEIQARALQAQSDQQFQASQAEINRKFTTGERLGTEDAAKSLQALEAQASERQATLVANLGLQSQEKQFGYTQALQAAAAAHDDAMQKRGFDATAANAEADRVFQQQMQAAGFTQAQAMQATAAQHESAMADKQMQQQYLMFTAQQAQEDSHFADSMNLDYAKMNDARHQFESEMDLNKEQLGITKDQWETTKADAKYQKDLDLVMTGIQMWNGDDPAAIAPFAARLAKTMGDALGMDPTKLQDAITSSLGAGDTTTAFAGGAGAPDTATAFKAFDSILDKKGGFANDTAREGVAKMAKEMANAASGFVEGQNALPRVYNNDIGKAVNSLKAAFKTNGVNSAFLQNVVNEIAMDDGSIFSSQKTKFTGIQPFSDYTIYIRLKNSGLKEADALAGLKTLIGDDRAAAALALEKGEINGKKDPSAETKK